MSKSFLKPQLPLMLLVGMLMVLLAAWKEEKFASIKTRASDTVPAKAERKIKNLDEAMAELDKAQSELERSMQDLTIPKIDAQKMQAEIQKAIKEIDQEKFKTQIEQAMKEINPEKIKAQIQEAMQQVDPEKIKASVAEAMKQVDVQKIKMQMQEAMVNVNMEKIKTQLEELKKAELPKVQEELAKVKPEVEAQLKKAKVEIEKAKTELKEYKAFEDGLEKDGLINKKENYIIEHSHGKLIINGKTQPEAVYNKYRSFLEKHKKFTLKKDDDGFKLNND